MDCESHSEFVQIPHSTFFYKVLIICFTVYIEETCSSILSNKINCEIQTSGQKGWTVIEVSKKKGRAEEEISEMREEARNRDCRGKAKPFTIFKIKEGKMIEELSEQGCTG